MQSFTDLEMSEHGQRPLQVLGQVLHLVNLLKSFVDLRLKVDELLLEHFYG